MSHLGVRGLLCSACNVYVNVNEYGSYGSVTVSLTRIWQTIL